MCDFFFAPRDLVGSALTTRDATALSYGGWGASRTIFTAGFLPNFAASPPDRDTGFDYTVRSDWSGPFGDSGICAFRWESNRALHLDMCVASFPDMATGSVDLARTSHPVFCIDLSSPESKFFRPGIGRFARPP